MDCRIRKLIVRSRSHEAVSQIVQTLENALRTACFSSLPPNALVLVRSLRLPIPKGPLAFVATARNLEDAGRTLAAQAVPATSPLAGRSPVVWFRDALEPMALLAVRLAEGRPAQEWFWKGAVPGWNPGWQRRDLPLLMKGAGRNPMPRAATARIAASLLGARRMETFLDVLTVHDAEELLRLFGLVKSAVREKLGLAKDAGLIRWLSGLDAETRRIVQARMDLWGPEDPRTVWLLALIFWLQNPPYGESLITRDTGRPQPSTVKDVSAGASPVASLREASDEHPPRADSPGTGGPPSPGEPLGAGRGIPLGAIKDERIRSRPTRQPLPHAPVASVTLSAEHLLDAGHAGGTTDGFPRSKGRTTAYHAPTPPPEGQELGKDTEHSAGAALRKTPSGVPSGCVVQGKAESGMNVRGKAAAAAPPIERRGNPSPTHSTGPLRERFGKNEAGKPSSHSAGRPDPRDDAAPEEERKGHSPPPRSPREGARPTRLRKSLMKEEPSAASPWCRHGTFSEPVRSVPWMPWKQDGRWSAHGGFLFLLGLFRHLHIQDHCRRPLGSGDTVGGALLHFLARTLGLPPDDPHWDLLKPEVVAQDGTPADFFSEPPSAWVEILAGKTGPLQRGKLQTLRAEPEWMENWFRAVRYVAGLFLKRRGGLSLRRLVERPGWILLTPTHADIFFRLDQTDVRIRRLGLDVDPGWIPWLTRVVAFHYLD